MGKNILVLLGSPSDDRKVRPGIEKGFDGTGFSYTVRYASADRTPELVEQRLFEEKYDGVIPAGSLSLVLAADVARHMDMARKTEHTPYYKSGWTPVIGLPLSDDFSGGVTAYLSITESPPGYPRAAVGIDRAESAAYCMARIFDDYEGVTVFNILADNLRDKTTETLLKLNERIQFPVSKANAYSDSEIPEKSLMIMTHNLSAAASAAFQNHNIGFGITVPRQEDNESIIDYIRWVENCRAGIHVGIGNGTNAAILAAQVMSIGRPEILDAIEEYRKPGRQKYFEEAKA